MYSVTSWRTNAKRGRRSKAARLSAAPVTKLSMPTTSQSRRRSASHRWDPMKPAAPVTSTRIVALRSFPRRGGSGRQDGLAADRVVLESETAHPFGLPEVAAVEDDRPPHRFAQSLEVEELELVPLGDERQRVGATGRLVGRLAVEDGARQRPAGVRHRHRIVGADAGAPLQQAL